MTGNLEKKAVKETLRKIVYGNNTIPHKAKAELEMIIELDNKYLY